MYTFRTSGLLNLPLTSSTSTSLTVNLVTPPPCEMDKTVVLTIETDDLSALGVFRVVALFEHCPLTSPDSEICM
jgi:hypothetical protein